MFSVKSKQKAKVQNVLNSEVIIGGVSDIDILLFSKHLSITLKSGLTLIEGLEILTDQAKGRMKKVLEDILDTVKSGEAFHTALEKYPKYFSPIFVNMVRSGEVAGTLDESLHRISIQLNKANSLRKKIRAAMIYPIMVFIAVFGLGMSVAIFVLPKILPLFKTLDIELPLTTRMLIKIAEVFEAHGFLIGIGLFVSFFGLMWFLKLNAIKPFTHRVILKLPIIKTIVTNINLERFTRIFGTLLDSGLTIDHSLRITAEATENRVYRKAILSLIPQVEAGNTLEMSISKYPKLFPIITTRMIGVGEGTGNLDSTLTYLAGFYEDLVDEATKNLSTIIEPVLLIIIGIVVGTVAISILGPIYQITGNIR